MNKMKNLERFSLVFFHTTSFLVLITPLIYYITVISLYGIKYIWLFPIMVLLTIGIDYSTYCFDDFRSPLRFILKRIIKIFKK